MSRAKSAEPEAAEAAPEAGALPAGGTAAPSSLRSMTTQQLVRHLAHNPSQQTAVVDALAPRGNATIEKALRDAASMRDDLTVLAKVRNFAAHINAATTRYGIPAAQLQAIIAQESRGEPRAAAGGARSASGLMQVTGDTWDEMRKRDPDLAPFQFSTHRFDPRVNILVGAAVLSFKMRQLNEFGANVAQPGYAELAVAAYNGGEGVIRAALSLARAAGSKDPQRDALRPEILKPAIRQFPAAYRYYMPGNRGVTRNPSGTVDGAVNSKFAEISKYPEGVSRYLRAQQNTSDLSTT